MSWLGSLVGLVGFCALLHPSVLHRCLGTPVSVTSILLRRDKLDHIKNCTQGAVGYYLYNSYRQSLSVIQVQLRLLLLLLLLLSPPS